MEEVKELPGLGVGEKGVILRGGEWKIHSRNRAICNTTELDALQEKLKAPQLPEMVFGNSFLKIEHSPSGLALEFTALGGLQNWDISKPADVTVSYAEKWQNERSKHSKAVTESYDWTFTTSYSGTLLRNGNPIKDSDEFQPKETDKRIDYAKLRIPEKILFFDEIILFQDELADNGDAILSAKVRAMPSGFFVLLQFWMRVDDVMFRIIASRIHHEYGNDYILREISVREESMDDLKAKGKFPKDPTQLSLPHIITPLLSIKSVKTETIHLPKGS
eukprot:TRINITY_DN12692_c0_g1_i1.p1 TRINITY_DN12692_c0_g1~~TRINITY_DN12692_c0_g1_i1.p1  ORF type:complete len:276 (-),score=45.16 TRINITY_DN12692_c0_g1_i1:52-879(-)